jgi:rhamnose transport system permease protein
MGLLNITGEIQTGVIGALLILSVLGPNIGQGVREAWSRRHRVQRIRVEE